MMPDHMEPPPPAADLIEGVAAIAQYLGWTQRKVYRAREQGWDIPIRKRDGLGIYAFRSELQAWLHDDATLPQRKVA